MFEFVKGFFDEHIIPADGQGISSEQLQVASAALMMEMLHMEQGFEVSKHDLIIHMLENFFSLSARQASDLTKIAEQRREQSTDYFEFTHLICDAFDHAEKLQLIECLWRIAYVDNHIDVEEEYLADKVARLLFIPHGEVLLARNKVKSDQVKTVKI